MQDPFSLEAWITHKPAIPYYEIQLFLLQEQVNKDQTNDCLTIEALIPCL